MIAVSLVLARTDALVVGVGVYKNDITPLGGIPKDIENIQQIFSAIGVPSEHTKILQDADANLTNVRAYFDNYIKSAHNNSSNRLFFYFTGHGLQVKDRSGDETDHKDEASALYDTEHIDNTITGGILLDDELYTTLSKIKSQKIVIFDKCHGDSSYRGIETGYAKVIDRDFKLSDDFASTIERIPKAKEGLKNLISLSASRDDELAEDSPLGGLFTQSLLQGIVYQKGKKYRDMTLQDLQNFCSENIITLAKFYRDNYKGTHNIRGAFSPQFGSYKYLKTPLKDIFDTKSSIGKYKPKKYLLEDTLDGLVTYDIIKPKLTKANATYKLHHKVSFELVSKVDAYLNVLIAYQDSYQLFMKNKKIVKDRDYTFPDDFFPEDSSTETSLRAKEPLGITKVYSIVSRKPLELERYIDKIKTNDLKLVHNFTKELMPSIEYDEMQKKRIRPVRKIREEKPNIIAISKVQFDVIK